MMTFAHQGKLIRPRLAGWIIALFMFQYAAITRGQEPQTGEAATEPPVTVAGASRYNIPWGSGGINFSAGLQAQYVDNVYLTHTDKRDDFILVPECDAAAFFPVGLSNTVVLDLGLAYYEYLKNTGLNTGTPVINPNSELAFNIRSGDFTFRLSESFSYQETPGLPRPAASFITSTIRPLFAATEPRRNDGDLGPDTTW